MLDLKKAMKLSVTYGLIGAVLMPIIYEIYANVSQGIGLFFAGAWVVFIGIKLSSLSFKEALIGITCTIAYTTVFGVFCYMAVHPAITKMLIERSVYFQLSLQEKFRFIMYCFWIFLGLYAIWIIRFGISKAIGRFKSNIEKTGKYIENAFDDEGEER